MSADPANAPSDASALPVVDTDVVEELMMLKAATGRDLLAEFLARVESGAALTLLPLRESYAGHDAAGVAAAAHTLKGTTGSYGLARASALASQITERARAGELDPAELVAFERALAEGIEALSAMHQRQRSTGG